MMGISYIFYLSHRQSMSMSSITCAQYMGCCQALERAFGGACQFAGTQYQSEACTGTGHHLAHFQKTKGGTSPRIVANRGVGGGSGAYPAPSHKNAAFTRACKATFLFCHSCHTHYDRRMKSKVRPKGRLSLHLGFDGAFRLLGHGGSVVVGEPVGSPGELADSGVVAVMSYFQLGNTALSQFFSLG